MTSTKGATDPTPPSARPPDDGELPSYRGRTPPPPAVDVQFRGTTLTRHQFTTPHEFSEQVTLYVTSHARPKDALPLFYNGSAVTGMVQIYLKNRATIRSITVTVRGFSRGTTEGFSFNEVFFLTIPTTIYTPPLTPHRSTSFASSSAANNKLDPGTHDFPFSIPLPGTFQVAEKGSKKSTGKTYDLPPSFRHKSFEESIAYDVRATVQRSFYVSDITLSTVFRYLPRTYAPLPDLATLSTLADMPIPDPTVFESKSLAVHGKLFERRDVEALYTLTIPTPTLYPLCHPIPIFILIQCTEAQPLDIFSTSSSLTVCLRRTVRLGTDASKTDSGFGKSTLVENVAKARVNIRPGIGDNGDERRLVGVLEPPGFLTPPFEFSSMSTSFAIVIDIHPLGFTAAKGQVHEIIIPVTLTTDTLASDPDLAPRYVDVTQ